MKPDMRFVFLTCRLRRVLSFAWLMAACSGQAWALDLDNLCKLNPHAMTELGPADSLSDIQDSAIEFKGVQVQSMPDVYAVSAPLSVDFPRPGSRLQFFYTDASERQDAPLLVGCLHYTDAQGQTRIRHNDFGSEGGSPPSIAVLYAANLAKGMGPTLFLVLKWPTEAHFSGDASGWLYELDAFGKLEAKADTDWNELLDLEKKIGDQYGLNGIREGRRVTIPTRTRRA